MGSQIVKDLLNLQRGQLEHYFAQVDPAEIEKGIALCLQTKGLIIWTGIGKSGIIAEKIAMTLVSTGSKSLSLPAANFLHGDIGILTGDDLLVIISKSGETEELLNLIPFAKQKGTKILAVVSNPKSRLAQAADVSIYLPVEKELCPFDLAPTTSTAVQLLFGDLVAAALMRLKGIGRTEYALNHPSGAIGKKMTLRVEDVMLKESHLPLCRPSDRLLDVLVELSNKKCGALLVVDEENKFLGIFTDGDLRRALQTHGSSILEKTMDRLMTPSPLSIQLNLLAWDAMKEMQKDPKKWVMVMPVLDGQKVVGILRMHDIIQSGIS